MRMIMIFKQFPFYIFLLPVFFVLHIVNEYYLLIPSNTVFSFIFYYLVVAALLFLFGKLIYKSGLKAGIWGTALLTIFFFFGAMHDFFIKLLHSHVITSYKMVLPLLLITGIFFSVYLLKTKQQLSGISKFLNVLFCLFTIIELLQLGYKKVSNRKGKVDFGYVSRKDSDKIKCSEKNIKPDIFFIVFDEYASSPSLEKNFSFKNSQLDSVFKSNNFYIAQNSKSNYDLTPLSIASTFNLDYFHHPMPDTLSLKFWLQGWYTLKMSNLPTLLAAHGYKILNYGLCDFNEYPAHTHRYITKFEARLLYEETLWGRIKKDIFWNFTTHIPFFNRYSERELNNTKKGYIERNFNNLQSVLSQLKTQESEPKFVFGHIMMPHTPYYLDQHGNLVPESIRIKGGGYDKKLYLDQLIYTNKLISQLINASNQPFERPRIIIIEGDHGFRDKDPSVPNEYHFTNLNTYFFSDKDYTSLYDSISPVNTFRIVLNKYFNTNLPLLKDSTIFIKH